MLASLGHETCRFGFESFAINCQTTYNFKQPQFPLQVISEENNSFDDAKENDRLDEDEKTIL